MAFRYGAGCAVRISGRHIIAVIELDIIVCVDAQRVVNALGYLQAHVVGHGAVIVVIHIGVNDDGPVRRQGGYQQSLVKGQPAESAVAVRAFLVYIFMTIGQEMAEQFGLAHPVMPVTVARAFRTVRNDVLCAGVIKDRAGKIVFLALYVVTPVGRACRACATGDNGFHALVIDGGHKSDLAVDRETFDNGLAGIDPGIQLGIFGNCHLQDVQVDGNGRSISHLNTHIRRSAVARVRENLIEGARAVGVPPGSGIGAVVGRPTGVSDIGNAVGGVAAAEGNRRLHAFGQPGGRQGDGNGYVLGNTAAEIDIGRCHARGHGRFAGAVIGVRCQADGVIDTQLRLVTVFIKLGQIQNLLLAFFPLSHVGDHTVGALGGVEELPNIGQRLKLRQVTRIRIGCVGPAQTCKRLTYRQHGGIFLLAAGSGAVFDRQIGCFGCDHLGFRRIRPDQAGITAVRGAGTAGIALRVPEADIFIGAPAAVREWGRFIPAGECHFAPVTVANAFRVRQVRVAFASGKVLGLAPVRESPALVENT